MRRSIATVCISGTLPDKLKAIARAGFDGVEIFESDLLYFTEALPGSAHPAGVLEEFRLRTPRRVSSPGWSQMRPFGSLIPDRPVASNEPRLTISAAERPDASMLGRWFADCERDTIRNDLCHRATLIQGVASLDARDITPRGLL